MLTNLLILGAVAVGFFIFGCLVTRKHLGRVNSVVDGLKK